MRLKNDSVAGAPSRTPRQTLLPSTPPAQSATATVVLLVRRRAVPASGRRGKRLDPSSVARSSTGSSAEPGPKLCPERRAGPQRKGLRTNALPSQRTPRRALLAARGKISEPGTRSFCGPPVASSGYVECFRRSATFNAAPSACTVQGCRGPVLVKEGSNVASQHSAPRWRWPRKRRSQGGGGRWLGRLLRSCGRTTAAARPDLRLRLSPMLWRVWPTSLSSANKRTVAVKGHLAPLAGRASAVEEHAHACALRPWFCTVRRACAPSTGQCTPSLTSDSRSYT